ncbi:MAG TPA: hypothetical protein VF132_07130 [Rudaea sp.]
MAKVQRSAGLRVERRTCYPSWPDFSYPHGIMIETNPIAARIADLTARVASLRGYL